MAPSQARLANELGKTSASQKVETYIKRAIYDGHLHPRERIIESDLADRLGVSRGTVREALLRLERDGLVVTTSRRGTFIRDISPQEIRVIFSMRGKLEGLCVRYMREAMRPKTEAALHEAIQRMKSAAARHNEEQFFYADMELHRTIWKLSGQPQLFRTLNLVMNPFIFIIARVYSSRLPIADRFENHCGYINTVLRVPLGRVEGEVERYFDKLYQRVFRRVIPAFHPSDGHSWLGSALVDD
jgi:DNA-binding GntR family transcriptional regulator